LLNGSEIISSTITLSEVEKISKNKPQRAPRKPLEGFNDRLTIVKQ